MKEQRQLGSRTWRDFKEFSDTTGLTKEETSGHDNNCLAYATFGNLGDFDPKGSNSKDKKLANDARRDVHVELMGKLCLGRESRRHRIKRMAMGIDD